MEYKLIKSDFGKILEHGGFEMPRCYEVKGDHILLTTGGLLWDYVVQHSIDSIAGLAFKYKIIEMVEECDGEAEDSDKELWDRDTRTYREWKIIKIN
jgi:hypothetical protein